MKKLIIANWKMNPENCEEAKSIFRKTQKVAEECRNIKTVVCPPFVFLSPLHKIVQRGNSVLGAQDVFWENALKDQGAHTGEISVGMLHSLDVRFVILGHSEKRALGETDEAVSRKIEAVVSENMTAIVCVGERERDDEGEYIHFIQDEVKRSLAGFSKKDISRIIIAYEPLWAVGPHAERADTPDGLFEMTILIRKTLADLLGRKNALTVRILYGGSVNEENAGAFLARGHADGLLVGRASLYPDVFGKILKVADIVRNYE